MNRFLHRSLHVASGFRRARDLRRRGGFVMMDTVAAMGFAAMVLPVSMMLLVASGDSGRLIRMKSDALWVVPLCLDAFTPEDGIRAFAVGCDGTLAGTVDLQGYRSGVADLDGRRVRYLCRVAVGVTDGPEDGGALRPVLVSLEGPAQAALGDRSKVSFHTLMK